MAIGKVIGGLYHSLFYEFYELFHNRLGQYENIGIMNYFTDSKPYKSRYFGVF